MALEGTLKDFALPDILQLIGIQRKTGILTMENVEDMVTVQFFQGQIVGADTRLQKLEDLLGSVLVRTGKITGAQLQEVLVIQGETLQRLGYILVKSGYLTEHELREALRIQISQIVYRLFRWRDGRYNFNPMDHLEYDRALTIPVSAESVLMEGARMIDEWPILERRIRSPHMIFRKTSAGAELEAHAVPDFVAQLGFDLDLQAGREAAGTAETATQTGPSAEEKEILSLLDGQATVQDIVDRSTLGEFDVYRILHDLLARDFIDEAHRSRNRDPAGEIEAARRLLGRGLLAVLLGVSLLSVLGLGSNPAAPWRLTAFRDETDRLRAYASRGRLERVDGAIEIFYLDLGALPQRLEALSRAGYLHESDLIDPWGRSYEYELGPDGYRLAGRDARGEPSEQLALSHRLSPAQRMILEGPAYAGPERPSPP